MAEPEAAGSVHSPAVDGRWSQAGTCGAGYQSPAGPQATAVAETVRSKRTRPGKFARPCCMFVGLVVHPLSITAAQLAAPTAYSGSATPFTRTLLLKAATFRS